jgi:hypothetical protein
MCYACARGATRVWKVACDVIRFDETQQHFTLPEMTSLPASYFPNKAFFLSNPLRTTPFVVRVHMVRHAPSAIDFPVW